MRTLQTFTINFLLFTAIMSLFSCSGTRPTNLGIHEGKLTDCPASPNCVSSDADDESHKTAAIQLKSTAREPWKVARTAVLKLPHTKIVTESYNYLHAECSSTVFGFVDDLELHLRPADGIIAVRSASRLGYSDFGVNAKRVESLRDDLINRGLSE